MFSNRKIATIAQRLEAIPIATVEFIDCQCLQVRLEGSTWSAESYYQDIANFSPGDRVLVVARENTTKLLIIPMRNHEKNVL